MTKTKLLLLLIATACSLLLQAQINENFTDGDFISNPQWVGNTADWTVTSGQLQSDNTTANSSFYLSTVSSLSTSTQWEFYVRLGFNTSSANYVDVYLTASASDITLGSTTGYFVRIGNTQDEIALYRKDANGTSVKIVDGVDGITNTSDNKLKIKVIRNAANQFTLYRDASGTGTAFISEGSVVDGTYSTSAFFGILIKQSTSSFFKRHFFDDIFVQPYVPDLTPPAIQGLSVLNAKNIDIVFSEAVQSVSSQSVANYTVNNGVGNPLTVQQDPGNAALVHLLFASNFSNGINHTITVNGVEDLAGNAIQNGTTSFSFYVPQRFDVVIDEIMADPTPQVGLPNAEFIELKNTSGRNLDLAGWKLSTATASSGTFPSYVLPADSFVILTSTSTVAQFGSNSRVISISGFPSLPNEGALLTLTSKEGLTVHAVEYSDDWYQNTLKKEGGWTLEMMDTKNPCTGTANWKASIDMSGGTPGRKNSVDGINKDQTPPQLLRTYSTDSVTIVAIFDEPLDSASASVINKYALSGATVQSVSALGPLFNTILLKLVSPLQKSQVYTLTVSGVSDCSGNAIGNANKAKVGLSEDAINEVVVNEILFNPKPNAYDYVELFNRGSKIIDASKLYIGNHNAAGAISSLKKMAQSPFFIFPGDYIVVTEDASSLQQQYLVKQPSSILTLTSLPSFSDDKGTVVITNYQGSVVDEVSYDHSWHFGLLDNEDGVALERIDPDGKSAEKSNWHSAATSVGYGTPTYKNSQYKLVDEVKATVEVSPKLFSPDNDGLDDIATISYKVDEPGYVANVIIFDASGRIVRTLARNDLLSLKGVWNWDGLGDKQLKLPIGNYVVFTEIFTLQGKKISFKNVVSLARRLN